MGDTRLERHGGPRPLVQHAESQRAEMHVPTAVVHRAQAEDLINDAHEHLANACSRLPVLK